MKKYLLLTITIDKEGRYSSWQSPYDSDSLEELAELAQYIVHYNELTNIKVKGASNEPWIDGDLMDENHMMMKAYDPEFKEIHYYQIQHHLPADIFLDWYKEVSQN